MSVCETAKLNVSCGNVGREGNQINRKIVSFGCNLEMCHVLYLFLDLLNTHSVFRDLPHHTITSHKQIEKLNKYISPIRLKTREFRSHIYFWRNVILLRTPMLPSYTRDSITLVIHTPVPVIWLGDGSLRERCALSVCEIYFINRKSEVCMYYLCYGCLYSILCVHCIK